MSAVARSHGRSPWREAFELLAARPQRSGAESLSFKQSSVNGRPRSKRTQASRKKQWARGRS